MLYGDPVVDDTTRHYGQLDREARRESGIESRQNLLIDDRDQFNEIVDSVVGSVWVLTDVTEEMNDWLMQNLIRPALAGGEAAKHIPEILSIHIKNKMWEFAEKDYDSLRIA